MRMPDHQRNNRGLAIKLGIFAAGSFGFGFALVPLYSVLCDITGYGDRTQLMQAANAVETSDGSPSAPSAGAQDGPPVTDRTVTIEFMSTTPSIGDWQFRPETGGLKAQPGKLYEAKFLAKNLRSQPVTAQAIPNIAPSQATRYFQKTECFCFTPQHFESEQTRELVVRFIVDPKLPVNIDRLTLGYSMYTSEQTALAANR